MEFTDRYGGRPPSWLRACHGPCEAMGVVPHFNLVGPKEAGMAYPVTEPDPIYDALWDEAHKAPHECDGWHFVKCADCGGSARVGWLTTAGRIPRWLWKGAAFMWRARTYPGPLPGQRRWAFFKMLVWSAYGADLAAIRR